MRVRLLARRQASDKSTKAQCSAVALGSFTRWRAYPHNLDATKDPQNSTGEAAILLYLLDFFTSTGSSILSGKISTLLKGLRFLSSSLIHCKLPVRPGQDRLQDRVLA
jgi:hypothetical protein